jgi:hypothetical protein
MKKQSSWDNRVLKKGAKLNILNEMRTKEVTIHSPVEQRVLKRVLN